mgnify:CR=1 FL=1
MRNMILAGLALSLLAAVPAAAAPAPALLLDSDAALLSAVTAAQRGGVQQAGGVWAAVRWRYLTIGLVLMLFLLSLAMVAGGILKFRAFPDLDGDTIEARILLRTRGPGE